MLDRLQGYDKIKIKVKNMFEPTEENIKTRGDLLEFYNNEVMEKYYKKHKIQNITIQVKTSFQEIFGKIGRPLHHHHYWDLSGTNFYQVIDFDCIYLTQATYNFNE